MQKIIVNITDTDNANLFVSMVEQLNFVDSVQVEDKEYDWVNPLRPATDEECEQMIAECEAEYDAGLYIPIEEAKKQTLESLEEWKKKEFK